MSSSFFVLGFLSILLNDLLDADSKTRGGLTILTLSMESRLELFYPFELFLKLYYLFPKDVLDSLILYGSASLEVLYYSTLYFDFGKILDNYFLSSGILIVFNKF